MSNDIGIYLMILFLIFAGIIIGFQIIYATSQGAPQCAFSRDMITCVEIARSKQMNEIEKMYELAGIKPVVRNNAIGRGYYIEHQRVEEYPPFTAEKQLELIDWFIRNEADVQVKYDYEDEVYYFKTEDDKETIKTESLAEALANLINIYFESFTDGEIEEINKILK